MVSGLLQPCWSCGKPSICPPWIKKSWLILRCWDSYVIMRFQCMQHDDVNPLAKFKTVLSKVWLQLIHKLQLKINDGSVRVLSQIRVECWVVICVARSCLVPSSSDILEFHDDGLKEWKVLWGIINDKNLAWMQHIRCDYLMFWWLNHAGE